MTEPSIMNEIEPGVTDSENTLFYLKPIDHLKFKKNQNVFLQRRMPKAKDTKVQEAQMIESTNLIEGENFQKDIEDIMGIIDDVESNMKEDKLSS